MRAVFILAVAAILSTKAEAASVKICFGQFASLTDIAYTDDGSLTRVLSDGTFEDFWTRNFVGITKQYRGPRGFKFSVSGSGVSPTSGILGDGYGTGDPGIGCASFTTTDSAGTLSFTFTSEFTTNGSTMKYVDVDSLAQVTMQVGCDFSGNGTSFCYYDTPTGSANGAIWKAMLVHSYSIWSHGGGLSGNTKYWKIGNPSNNGSTGCSCAATLDDQISQSCNLSYNTAMNRKYIMSHELGHWIGCKGTSRKTTNHNVLYVEGDNACPEEDSTAHSMRSLEGSATALSEGYAHFYAADIWNNDSQTNCAFSYYKTFDGDSTPTVDCEASPTDYSLTGACAVRYAETQCSGSSSGLIGHGTELDWLRTFWDMHTNSNPVGPTGFNDILSLMNTSAAWGNTTAYTNIYNRSQLCSCTAGTRFMIDSATNGLDGVP